MARVALRSQALLIVVCVCSARLATAQNPVAAAGPADTPRIDVHAQADGSLGVTASNASIDDVVRAVAAAADIQVSTLGTPSQARVTVSFADARPATILRELMDPAGISYVMTPGAPGRPGRLIMGVLAPSSGRAQALSDRPVSVVERAVPVQERQESVSADPGPTPASEPEWPAEVQPVNQGPAAALPDTREALFQMVNGSAPVELPAGFSPNPGATGRPMPIGPANPVRTDFGFSASGASSQPGVIVTTGDTPGPVGPVAPIDPSMMQAPKTFAIPAPVVVQFPPPAAP